MLLSASGARGIRLWDVIRPNLGGDTTESGPRDIRLWDVIRPNLGGDTTESGPRCNRVWDEKRLRLLPRSLTSRKSVFLIRCDEVLGRSTVAHFARKVRGANIVADKH